MSHQDGLGLGPGSGLIKSEWGADRNKNFGQHSQRATGKSKFMARELAGTSTVLWGFGGTRRPLGERGCGGKNPRALESETPSINPGSPLASCMNVIDVIS